MMTIIHYKQVALRIGQCLFSVHPSIYLEFLEKSHDRDSSSSNIKLLEMSYKEQEDLNSEVADFAQSCDLSLQKLDSYRYQAKYNLKSLCLCCTVDYKQREISDNKERFNRHAREASSRLQNIALKISGYELVEDLFKARIVICMLYKPKFLERSVFNIIPNDVVDHIITHVKQLPPTGFDWLKKFDTTFHYEQHGAHQLSHRRLRILPLKKVS